MKDKMILNGELIDGRRLSLGATSRGFAYGYGVFETIKFIDARPCFWAEHMQRLGRAVAGASLRIRIDPTELRAEADRLFAVNGVREGVFKIIVSEDDNAHAQLAMFVRDAGPAPALDAARLLLSPVVKASQAFTSRHKTLNYMETVRELAIARPRGFDECVYCNELGQLTETSVSNLFFVKDGRIRTPALECGLLDGIIRGQLLALAEEMGIPAVEGRYGVEDLLQADEVFLTNSGIGARPVESFEDGRGRSAAYRVELAAVLAKAFAARERASLTSD